jgi:hypothetical protein
MNKAPAATALTRENRPKLGKIIESQRIRTSRGVDPPITTNAAGAVSYPPVRRATCKLFIKTKTLKCFAWPLKTTPNGSSSLL